MTDGGRVARRNGRVYTEECHPSHDLCPSEASPAAVREVKERQVEKKSHSRGSSCSDISVIGSESEVHTSMKIPQMAVDATECDNTIEGSSQSIDGPPENFGIVIPGLYRSAFPRTKDYTYLESLGLKTIVTLSSKDHPDDYDGFIKKNEFKHIIINMEGTKKVAIPKAIMDSVLEAVLDVQNYPLLLHCNHGKHRTGCVVAVIRKIWGWHIDSIIEEYTSYAEPKIRSVDINYVQAFKVESFSDRFAEPSFCTSTRVRGLSLTKMIKMLIIALMMLSLWRITVMQIRS